MNTNNENEKKWRTMNEPAHHDEGMKTQTETIPCNGGSTN